MGQASLLGMTHRRPSVSSSAVFLSRRPLSRANRLLPSPFFLFFLFSGLQLNQPRVSREIIAQSHGASLELGLRFFPLPSSFFQAHFTHFSFSLLLFFLIITLSTDVPAVLREEHHSAVTLYCSPAAFLPR